MVRGKIKVMLLRIVCVRVCVRARARARVCVCVCVCVQAYMFYVLFCECICRLCAYVYLYIRLHELVFIYVCVWMDMCLLSICVYGSLNPDRERVSERQYSHMHECGLGKKERKKEKGRDLSPLGLRLRGTTPNHMTARSELEVHREIYKEYM